MAKVFLDTNYFIDAIHREPEKQIVDCLKDSIIYISTLSFHIYCYIYKIKMPNKKVVLQKEKFQLVDFSEEILERALHGPTVDFENNVQLHSAVDAECDFFLTHDAKILNLKFFGKTQLVSKLSWNKLPIN